MGPLSYLWNAFDLHHKLFSYIPYPKLLNWDRNKKEIYCITSQRKLFPWYVAIIIGVWISGVLSSILVLFEQRFRGNLPGLMTTVNTIVIGATTTISGGTAVVTIYYQETICQYFRKLVCIHKKCLIVKPAWKKGNPRRLKLKPSEFLLLKCFINSVIFCFAIVPTPAAILVVYEKLEPFGLLLELYAIPQAHKLSTLTRVLLYLFRLVVGCINILEAARSVSFQILVFIAVTQIYIVILKECIQVRCSPYSLEKYIMLQMIHESATAPGNILISLLMGGAININVMSLWIVIYCWNKVPWFIYSAAFGACFVIPATVIALLPLASNIHDISKEILRQFSLVNRKQGNVVGRTDLQRRKLRIRALRKVFFCCGNFFKLQRFSNIEYLQVTIDRMIDVILGIPPPS